jgi:CheY-like chemotaxis protein
MKTILCIDDDIVSQMLSKLILETANIFDNVLEAMNGEEAMKLLNEIVANGNQKSFPEVILLDLNMPIMGGWEFIEAFSTYYSAFSEKTKIFILSSSINPIDSSKAKLEKLVSGFLPKPLSIQDVLAFQ